jgi:nucleotide-binding universal stress UspA family protein
VGTGSGLGALGSRHDRFRAAGSARREGDNLDRIVADLARDKAEHGTDLARAAGFNATTMVARGKAWEAVCEVADELDAEPIVIGSRGLGRAQSALLGSVSSAVIAHAKRAVLVGPTHSVSGSGPARSE